MKLGTLRNGRPDGHLVVVSSDLSRCVSAGRVASNLQSALDNWPAAAPALQDLSAALNDGRISAQPFDATTAMAPLPRSYQRIEAAAYPNHLERLQGVAAAKTEEPRRPLLYQAASDQLAGPTDPLLIPDVDASPDFGAEIVAVLGDVASRPSREDAVGAIRLLTISNDITYRKLVAADLQGGVGYFQAKPAAAFAPVAVTPDEFGTAWRSEKLHLPVRVLLNNMLFGQPNAGIDMRFDFADLIMAAAETRALGAGTLLGAGVISNRHDETPPIRREGAGFAAIAEARAVEKAKYGRARAAYLKAGDRVRIAAMDANERPVFGTIDQTVALMPRK